MIATYYDLDLDRELDYMVIRKVIRKASAEETTIEKAIEIAKFDNLSVFFSHPVVYFTNGNPLFYCKGVDHRGNCRGDMWVDIAEDGLNGNEELNSYQRRALGFVNYKKSIISFLVLITLVFGPFPAYSHSKHGDMGILPKAKRI